ncbi:SGT1 domain-containing protein [Venturia nashicola]|nr:SGT1 domain-containing protein [Venturia nashicola]
METPQDMSSNFEKGFEPFLKSLPDDTIEYVIYIIDSKLTDVQVRSRLNIVLQAANTLIKNYLTDYIWQRDDFKLALKREDGIWLLRGRSNFGDSSADEWLIVYLVRELSKQFPDAWMRVSDTDGEFLLIEAANTLPKWLNPEIAEHRVWINKGELRIIPMEKNTSSSRNLTVKQALAAITSSPSTLIHSSLIEEEAFYRIRDHPKAISETLHHSVITIPRKVAYILHEKLSYISAATEAFYLRDPIALRPLQQDSPSALTFPPTDFISTSIAFTKVGYAQLKSQEFPPPQTWHNSLPKSTSAKEATGVEIGMKLSCGFEMLVSDPQNQDKKDVREIKLLLEDIENGEESLPTDKEMQTWSRQDDDDAWLDINYEDFERELAGKTAPKAANRDAGPSAGFGDKSAQENLRKMVERFEAFMNDEDAGAEGINMDDMDFDDDEDEDEDEDDSDEEDKDVSFDEQEFAKMMREMMGMPPNDTSSAKELTERVEELDGDSDDEQEDEEIRKLSERMELELNENGALNLDPTPRRISVTRSSNGKGKEKAKEESSEESDGEGGEVDIDYNLAKNMLEAFKGQTGMAGPAGNLMGLMGVKLPRDEQDEDDR